MGCRWILATLPLTVVAGILVPHGTAAADGLEEIVVTAQKRNQLEQDVPITMSVITGSGVQAHNGGYGAELLGKNIFNRYTQDFSSPSVAPYFQSLASPAPLRTVNLSLWSHF
jgi:outer membrane receptor protein involved in Fe transport